MGVVKIRGFKIDENGDIVISKQGGNVLTPNGKQIQMVEGNELIAQKILIALGTNKGEWFWNSELGINYDFIIGKGVTEDMIRSQIEIGIRQVDSNMFLSEFNVDIDKAKRTARITFVVENSGGKIAKIEKVYGGETTDIENRMTTYSKITAYENALERIATRLTQSKS